MVDRNKVVKALEIHINRETDCIGCPYLEDGGTCIMHLQRDALELLKEQEQQIKFLKDKQSNVKCDLSEIYWKLSETYRKLSET